MREGSERVVFDRSLTCLVTTSFLVMAVDRRKGNSLHWQACLDQRLSGQP